MITFPPLQQRSSSGTWPQTRSPVSEALSEGPVPIRSEDHVPPRRKARTMKMCALILLPGPILAVARQMIRGKPR